MAFEDFQCPNCRIFSENVETQLFTDYVYTGRVRFDYRHFIVIDRGGSESRDAARASECAAEQGWFWPFHEMLFTNQRGENAGDFTTKRLKAFAGDLDLDQAKFNSCLDSRKFDSLISADEVAGRQFGVTGTPTVVITPGNTVLGGVRSYDEYKQAIDAALAAAGG
jgi:protein-disulfide isomerase